MTFFDNFTSIQLIAAHRGYRAIHPENTFSAFHASIGRCHFIELDIQISKDFVPVVIHDATLERTSNAKELYRQLGVKTLNVSDWTLPELKSLDVGSWFLLADPFSTIADRKVPPDPIRKNYSQKIMTLEEVLCHPALRKLPVNIEIKDHKGKKQHKQVTEIVIDVVKKTTSQDRVLLSSFNHDYLVIAKTFAPKISLGALQDYSHPPDIIEYLREIGAAAYHPSDTIIDARMIKKLRAAGIGVNVYTVNSKERQKELFTMGVTAIFTDFPDLS
jgi:glycerophosphoryl diester phosphodiesterase